MKKTKYILLIMLLSLTILLISSNIYASDINNTYNTDNDKTNIAKENNNKKLTNNENTGSTNTTRQVYNEKTVVPHNTSEKTYNKTKNMTEKTEDIKLDHYTQLDGNDGYMPFYMDDDTIAICIEPEKHSPDEDIVYTVGKNHTIINHKNGNNVTDYIKIYLYNHILDENSIIYRESDNSAESSLRWGVWYFILQDYEKGDYLTDFVEFTKNV